MTKRKILKFFLFTYTRAMMQNAVKISLYEFSRKLASNYM